MGIIIFVLIILVTLGILLTALMCAKGDATNALLLFIAYESLLYPVFKGLESSYYAKLGRKMIHVKGSSNPELLECKINKTLTELSEKKFTIIDVKITQVNRRDRIINEAYILYY